MASDSYCVVLLELLKMYMFAAQVIFLERQAENLPLLYLMYLRTLFFMNVFLRLQSFRFISSKCSDSVVLDNTFVLFIFNWYNYQYLRIIFTMLIKVLFKVIAGEILIECAFSLHINNSFLLIWFILKNSTLNFVSLDPLLFSLHASLFFYCLCNLFLSSRYVSD